MAGGESLPRTFVRLVYTHICESGLGGSAEESGPTRRGAPRRGRQLAFNQRAKCRSTKEKLISGKGRV